FDPRLVPALQARRLERARSDAKGRLWHIPRALRLRAVDSVLAVRFRFAGDHQGSDRLCVHTDDELGADGGLAQDTRRDKGAVILMACSTGERSDPGTGRPRISLRSIRATTTLSRSYTPAASLRTHPQAP